jgi:hypothetical protein
MLSRALLHHVVPPAQESDSLCWCHGFVPIPQVMVALFALPGRSSSCASGVGLVTVQSQVCMQGPGITLQWVGSRQVLFRWRRDAHLAGCRCMPAATWQVPHPADEAQQHPACGLWVGLLGVWSCEAECCVLGLEDPEGPGSRGALVVVVC